MPQLLSDNVLNLPKTKIKSIINDPAKSAAAVKLVYVNDTSEGIIRQAVKNEFSYSYRGKVINDEDVLIRIKKLAIPPAWQNVWICPKDNGHLQATGFDVKGRKQYRYHELWNMVRNHTKFYRLHEFGKILPELRLQVEKDLARKGLPVEKVLATVVSLMERTNIRIGNACYEKENGSFGITTLKDKHVKVQGEKIKFSFKGKKGVYHDIDIKSKRLAAIVKKCQDVPGKELFQFIDDEGNRKTIDSGSVNDYIKNYTGGDFTAKDLRTWSGTVQAFLALRELGISKNQMETKKNIVAALDSVAKTLGNTRTVCKKYYVHPMILALYETKTIEQYFKKLEHQEKNDNKAALTTEEKILLHILSSENK